MASQRVVKLRKQFWVPFLLILVLPLLFVFAVGRFKGSDMARITGVAIFLYAAAYTHGYVQGKEHMRSVLDFMETGLQWKVLDAEGKMYDSEDREYYKSQRGD